MQNLLNSAAGYAGRGGPRPVRNTCRCHLSHLSHCMADAVHGGTCDESPGGGTHAHHHTYLGLILTALAVQYILNGVAEFYRGLIG